MLFQYNFKLKTRIFKDTISMHKGIKFDTIERKISIFQFINQDTSIVK